ncbi:LmbU family transcriptional regulator [Streptomyces sp. NPDC014744]|uniref:LmbU family transcriptional regulator n=1 Tax=Streptomyces sp. NPDC014744 TaxID=3364903 RepID=UPI00370215F7
MRQEPQRLNISHAATTRRTSLILPARMPLEEWKRLGQQIFLITDSSAWWLGDWLVYGQETFPDRYRRAVRETSLDYQTLRNYAWVARNIRPGRRHSALSFQHHAEVVALPENEQDSWLGRAEEQHWSRNQLRSAIRSARALPAAHRGAAPVGIQMTVAPERQRLWQGAANRRQCDLLEWIALTLDKAAQVEGSGDLSVMQ